MCFTVHHLHLYDGISLEKCGLCLGIKYEWIPAQSHHTVMTLKMQRHKLIIHSYALTI